MAGAGYKLFNTGDVLTAAQVNTYLNEQTVMVFASSAARTSALSGVLAEGMVSYLQDTNAVEVYNGSAWVGVSGAGDVTEVQAGTGISVASGTGPIPVVTNTMATAIDAEGDLIIGDAADAFQRLAIGSNTHVLTVDTSVDGKIKWAAPAAGGGMTLISTTTLSGASTTITVAGNSYLNLVMFAEGIDCSSDQDLFIQLNGETGATAYTPVIAGSNNGTAYTNYSKNNGIYLNQTGTDGFGTGNDNSSNITIYNANSTIRKTIDASVGAKHSAGRDIPLRNTCTVASTAVISSIVFKLSGGTFDGGTIKLYGVK